MNCSNCGRPMSSKRENVKYDSCGLDYVTLLDIEVRRCRDCGEREIVIPNVEGLHLALARAVAHLPVRLRGREIRFLRKHLGYSGADAAKALSVRPETMSRWENDKDVISPAADRFLRLMIANQNPTQFYSPAELQAKKQEKRPSPIRMRRSPEWQLATSR